MNERTKQLLKHNEFVNQEGSEYEGTEFGEFGQYIANKVVKLRNQALEAQEGRESNIFEGCIIYITGYTEPSAPELKRLITLHGGVHALYFTGKTAITHIIANSLTARKREEYAKFKVVRASWILECIRAGKLLPWRDFKTIEVEKSQGIFAKPVVPVITDSGEEETDLKHANTTAADEPDRIFPVNCLAPDFIESFYRKSRLHHLSTWKAELKRKYQGLALAQNRKRTEMIRKRKRDVGPIRISARAPKLPQRLILHIDFDSFFVSVGLLKSPHLKDKPVGVSNGLSGGSSDIASCNYVARKFGVRNGMWASSAVKLCPDLQVLPYDFEGYEKASDALYNVLMELDPDILFPVSVDEALLDITSLIYEDRQGESSDDSETVRAKVNDLCNELRNKVRMASGIEVSVGVGPNVLLAKIALQKAKPAGQHYICGANALEELNELRLSDLPGIGSFVSGKLAERYIYTVEQVRQVNVTDLESLLGAKVGRKLHDYAFGRDNTDISVITPPKSIGVEINWGVRVKNQLEMDLFVSNLAKELSTRMQKEHLQARHLTCKISRRAANAPIDPPKFMGCGECDQFSKSQPIEVTNNASKMAQVAKELARSFQCPPTDLRGVGLQVKLDEKPVRPLTTTISPSGPRIRSMLQTSKMKAVTLTQKFKPAIDKKVLDELPDDVKHEVLRQYGHPEELSNEQTKGEIELGGQVLQGYVPVFLNGKSKMSDIRSLLRTWIKTGREKGPHADDVKLVEDFLVDVVEHDRNWGKAIELVDWLYLQVPESNTDAAAIEWRTLFDIYDEMVKKNLRSKGLQV